MPARASASFSARAVRTFSSISPLSWLMATRLSMMARLSNSKSPRDPRASRPRTSSPSNPLRQSPKRAARFGVPPVFFFVRSAPISWRCRARQPQACTLLRRLAALLAPPFNLFPLIIRSRYRNPSATAVSPLYCPRLLFGPPWIMPGQSAPLTGCGRSPGAKKQRVRDSPSRAGRHFRLG